jgi:hypothetical protein
MSECNINVKSELFEKQLGNSEIVEKYTMVNRTKFTDDLITHITKIFTDYTKIPAAQIIDNIKFNFGNSLLNNNSRFKHSVGVSLNDIIKNTCDLLENIREFIDTYKIQIKQARAYGEIVNYIKKVSLLNIKRLQKHDKSKESRSSNGSNYTRFSRNSFYIDEQQRIQKTFEDIINLIKTNFPNMTAEIEDIEHKVSTLESKILDLQDLDMHKFDSFVIDNVIIKMAKEIFNLLKESKKPQYYRKYMPENIAALKTQGNLAVGKSGRKHLVSLLKLTNKNINNLRIPLNHKNIIQLLNTETYLQ